MQHNTMYPTLNQRWFARFTELAKLWASFSTCKRRRVGAVIVDTTTLAVVSMGYNDTGLGKTNCGDGGCEVCSNEESTRLNLDCACIHAEMNALLLAARRGTKTEGCTLVIWGCEEVCSSCFKHLTQAGIGEMCIGQNTNMDTRQKRPFTRYRG